MLLYLKGEFSVKKILYMLLALVLISANLFGYFLMSNKQLVGILYKNNKLIHISYSKTTKDINYNELLQHIINFSNDKKINISQYYFQSKTDLNIYSANISNDLNIHIESGEIPQGTTYLSNKNLESTGKIQSGIFSSHYLIGGSIYTI